MDTKKRPIENYITEDTEKPYRMSRRDFLKLGALGTNAILFGEGFLKQMDAWAQDGISVYIQEFGDGGYQSQATFYNLGKTVTNDLKINLIKKGIDFKDKTSEGIVIFGQCKEIFGTIHVNIGYKVNGKPATGYSVDEQFNVYLYPNKIQEITDKVYQDINDLEKEINRKRGTRSGSRIGTMSDSEEKLRELLKSFK